MSGLRTGSEKDEIYEICCEYLFFCLDGSLRSGWLRKKKDAKDGAKQVDLSLTEAPSKADPLQLFMASIDAYNGQDLAALIAMLAPTVEWIHRTASANVVRGRAASARQLMQERNAFPDCTIKLERILVRGNNLVVQGTFKGTQRGVIHGIQPSGKKVVYDFVYFVAVANGKIERNISYFNPATPMKQIGAIRVRDPLYPETHGDSLQVVRDGSSPESEEGVKKFYALWKAGKFDGLGGVVADGVVFNNRARIETFKGIDAVGEYMKSQRKAFEGITWDVRGMVSFGAYVVVQVVKRGAFGMKIQSAKAPLLKELEIDVTHLFKLDGNGKIAQVDEVFDEFQVYQQFGYSIPAAIEEMSEVKVSELDGGVSGGGE